VREPVLAHTGLGAQGRGFEIRARSVDRVSR
jgi:hypothetical protein